MSASSHEPIHLDPPPSHFLLFRVIRTPAQPRVLPPNHQVTEHGDATSPSSPFPSTANGAEALDEQGSAFSALLRADVGQALGVSMKAVSVGGVFPAGEMVVDWKAWRQWGAGALNVSLEWSHDGPGTSREGACLLVHLVLIVFMDRGFRRLTKYMVR